MQPLISPFDTAKSIISVCYLRLSKDVLDMHLQTTLDMTGGFSLFNSPLQQITNWLLKIQQTTVQIISSQSHCIVILLSHTFLVGDESHYYNFHNNALHKWSTPSAFNSPHDCEVKSIYVHLAVPCRDQRVFCHVF